MTRCQLDIVADNTKRLVASASSTALEVPAALRTLAKVCVKLSIASHDGVMHVSMKVSVVPSRIGGVVCVCVCG